jgi:hypothetical protein
MGRSMLSRMADATVNARKYDWGRIVVRGKHWKRGGCQILIYAIFGKAQFRLIVHQILSTCAGISSFLQELRIHQIYVR